MRCIFSKIQYNLPIFGEEIEFSKINKLMEEQQL